ncbi:Type II secretion system protein E [bacterium HR35]|nr:Type II secretion system protein E [bacterium HR35]
MKDIWEEIKKRKREQEEFLAQRLATELGVPYFNFDYLKPNPSALEFIPKEIAEKLKLIPIEDDGKKITIALVNPLIEGLKEFFQSLREKRKEIVWGIISESSLAKGLEEYGFLNLKKIKITKTLDIKPEIVSKINQELTRKEMLQAFCQDLIKESPFFILDTLIAGALKFEASDIHLEPYEDRAVVRYRLDGLLYDVLTLPRQVYEVIKNRLKIISGLMLNITDKPQDGSFSLNYQGERIDFRISSLPTDYGEAFVIRVLIFAKIIKNLEELGLREDDYQILLKHIYSPNGLILNTGPTGSGKTTTLYSILLKIKKPEIKIITLENPIEYRIEGITQVEIDEKRNLTFAEALRSFLRHDPDVILVGEIRDKETAITAVQASLTGHLVLSTLHTNDSLGAIPRLISLEVDKQLISSSLKLVIAQRLVRKICQNCKEEYQPDEETKNKIKKYLNNLPNRVKLNVDWDKLTLAKGLGCSFCFNTGYKGRIAIFELFEVKRELEPIILKNPTEEDIFQSIKDDFVTLKQDGLIKVIQKITTIEEVERVAGLL